MRKKVTQRGVLTRAMALVSLVLVLSIGIHTVEATHNHPYHGGHSHPEKHGTTVSELSVYLHAGERKFLALVPLLATVLPFLSILLLARGAVPSPTNRQSPPTVTDYLRMLFRRGILHPKLYSSLVMYG